MKHRIAVLMSWIITSLIKCELKPIISPKCLLLSVSAFCGFSAGCFAPYDINGFANSSISAIIKP